MTQDPEFHAPLNQADADVEGARLLYMADRAVMAGDKETAKYWLILEWETLWVDRVQDGVHPPADLLSRLYDSWKVIDQDREIGEDAMSEDALKYDKAGPKKRDLASRCEHATAVIDEAARQYQQGNYDTSAQILHIDWAHTWEGVPEAKIPEEIKQRHSRARTMVWKKQMEAKHGK